MFVAQELRTRNIAEFLLYMWQVEDIVRAFGLDIDKISQNYIARFDQWTPSQKTEAANWYQDLINMMRSEKVAEKGHLRICHNVVINLTDLHNSLMASQKFPYYRAAYNEALPLIVEFRSKQPDCDSRPEIESCFDLLYGITMLRLRKMPVSDDTLRASKTISTFIGMLSNYYHENLKSPLDL